MKAEPESFETIKQNMEKIRESLNEQVKDHKKSNGFLTSKGKIWSNSEGHAIFVPIGFVSSAFMLPTPLGELTFVAMLGFLRKASDKCEKERTGHWADVIHDIGYFAMAMAVTIYFWTYHSDMVLSEIDMTQLVLAMLGGA